MKWTVAILIIVGAVAAFCAAVLVVTIGGRGAAEQAAAVAGPHEIEILVATRPLDAMTVLDASAVAKKTVMSDEAPANAIRNHLLAIGQVLVTPVVEGQVFTEDHFATAESGLHLATTLPAGHRAMSVLLTTDTGIEQILYPGALVDVVASFRLPSAQGRPAGEVISATLLQGVQVLGVGPRSIVTREGGDEAPAMSTVDRKVQRRVTLMVDADQGEALQLASAYGELTLALRNPLDVEAVPDRGVLLSELSDDVAERLAALGVTPAYPPMFLNDSEQPSETPRINPTAPGRLWTTTILRGRQGETVTFPVGK